MGLRSFYYKQEEKYFKWLDNLEKKGINLYKIVDPLEKKGIPTFFVFNLIILLLILFLVYLFIGSSPVTDDSYTLRFTDSFNNPIPNETIRVMFGDTEKLLVTDEMGISTVTGVKKESLSFAINSDKYSLETPLSVNFNTQNNYNVYLASKTGFFSKTINFKSNNELFTSPLTVSEITCSENSNYLKTNLITNDGTLTLSDVPTDCGYLNILINSPTINTTESFLVDNDNTVKEVNLSFQESRKGNVSLRFLDKDLKTPINNLSIGILNKEKQIAREGVTNSNGVVVFNDLLVGTYTVLSYDLDDRYKPLTELDNIQIIITENILEEKEVLLEKAYIGHLKFKVIDNVSKEAIPNVSVSLYKSNTLVKTLQTNIEGLVTFGVEENITYKVIFNNENYIIKTENNLKISDTVRQVILHPLTSENLNSLLVTVEDAFFKPIDFAVVRLWDAEENIVIKTMTADVYGKVVIPNLDSEKTYKLDAIKGDFVSEHTNPFRIVPQEINEQKIKMIIGEGTFNISLITDFGENYQGNVFVYDASNDLILEDKITSTNQEGFTFIKIRADKEVYFVIDNYDSKLITPRYKISAEEIKNLEFVLPRTTSTSSIEFIGFYNSLGEKINSVTSGQQVTAKFVVNASKKYSKIVAHIRTGDAPSPACSTTTYNVLEDNLFIKEIRFAKPSFVGSETFTPCLGETTDFSNKTLRNAKWFNLTINNPMEGSYLVEADIVVLDTALQNQFVNYRAEFFENSTIFRSPVDNSLTNSTKQPLYAQVKQAILFIGSQNQCSSLLCYSVSIRNTQTNLTRNIIDNYNAQINNDYRLSFNLNILEGKNAPNSYLSITTGNSVRLQEYSINSVSGNLLTGTDFSEIEIGSLTSNDFISGDLSFRVIDDVSDVVKISLISNGEEVFSKSILIDIKEAKEMQVEMFPRKIIPLLPNDVILKVTDSQGSVVPEANVNVLLNDYVITTGNTDAQGLFGFILPAPDLNDTLRIIVTKNEYRMNDTSVVIDDKVITPVPQEIILNLDTSRDVREIYNFSLLNNTSVPLSIVSVSTTTNNEFVTLNTNLSENIINGDSQADVELVATLTEKGINLYTQQTIKTTVQVRVRNDELNKTWMINIPVTVRVVLGNALDSLDCLKILPLDATIRTTASEEKTIDFTIENKCSSNLNAVDLGNIIAMVDWENKTESGVLSLVINNREYILENLQENIIIPSMPRNTKTTATLKFKAHKVTSSVTSPTIHFSSLKGNMNGIDEIKSSLKTNIIVNNYSECIDIPQQPVPVIACNWFSGMGMYDQYYGQGALGQFNRNLNPALYNQQMSGGYFGGVNYAQSYNMNRQFNPLNQYQYAPGYMTQQQGYNFPQQNLVGQTGYFGQQASTVYPYNYPTSQYQNQYSNYNYYNFMDPYMQGGYGGMGFTNSMNCPVRPFTVTNNCLEAVDIKLEQNYGVVVSSDKEFTLEPNQSTQVLVTGAEEMGTFRVPVTAKPSLASENVYSLVGEVPVNVTLPLSFMPSKCIQVTPQKLDFSNIFDPKYQLVKVMNTCFDQGYRLVEVNYLDLTSLDFDGVSFLNVGDMQGRIQPIKVDYLTDLQTNKPIEVWDIALRRNPEIKNTSSAKAYMNKYGQNSIAAGVISTFRRMLIDVEDEVNLKFVLQVGLQPPHGMSSLVYHNVGMELKDNFQWLILDNRDNWEIIKEFLGKDLNYSIFTADELLFVDTSVKLTYDLEIQRDGRNIVFIKVPEDALTKNKFRRVDLEETAQRCFMGMVKDFPINGINETSHIQDLGLFYLDESYTSPLKVSIEFIKKHYFKLCFERPIETIDNDRRENNKLEIYDFFKDKNTKEGINFTIMQINPNTQQSVLQGHTLIGVDTRIETNPISGVSVQEVCDDGKSPVQGVCDDGSVPKPVTTEALDLSCYDPTLTSKDGVTGKENYELLGFDQILFEYDSNKITETSCEEYYCDQEQFYDYLKKKADSLENTQDKVKLGEILFYKDGESIKKSDAVLDLCVECNEFDEKETLETYIKQAKDILEKVPKHLREITIIKTKVTGISVIPDTLIMLGGNHYMSVEYFLETFKYDDLTNAQKIEFYLNMEVFIGDSPNLFVSKLKKFSNTNEPYNTNILKSYKTSRSLFNDYNYTYTENTNVSSPGEYLIILKKNGNDLSIKIGDKVNDLDEEYSKNPLFFNPINPLFAQTNNSLNAPFLPEYTKTTYTVNDWAEIQKGYIFTLENMANYRFIDSRPIYFNENYSGKLVNTATGNVDVGSYSGKNLFLLKDTTSNFAIYSNPQITNIKNMSVFSILNEVDNNFKIYNVLMNNMSPNISYKTMKDVFEQINNENVCLKIEDSIIKLWHNPSKFK